MVCCGSCNYADWYSYADNLKSDLLIIQDAQDPLVIKEESEQMVNMLQKKGKYVEY